MDALALETLSLRPKGGDAKRLQHAETVAGQFEEIFVRTLVSSLRQTASCGGEAGMFGEGPGSDTYADWFDQNVAEQVGKSGRVGIKAQVLADMQRHGEIDRPAGLEAARDQVATAKAAASRAQLDAARSLTKGGLDVLR